MVCACVSMYLLFHLQHTLAYSLLDYMTIASWYLKNVQILNLLWLMLYELIMKVVYEDGDEEGIEGTEARQLIILSDDAMEDDSYERRRHRRSGSVSNSIKRSVFHIWLLVFSLVFDNHEVF